MAQYDDLELLEIRRAKTQNHERQHPPHHQVHERPPHQLLPSSIAPATLRTRRDPKRPPPPDDRVFAPHTPRMDAGRGGAEVDRPCRLRGSIRRSRDPAGSWVC
jgi:hypothetical protein